MVLLIFESGSLERGKNYFLAPTRVRDPHEHTKSAILPEALGLANGVNRQSELLAGGQ